MLEELKILLGDSVASYTDAQLSLAIKLATAEIELYCNRELDAAMECCVLSIAVIKLNRIGTEGLAAQTPSGISESYINGYPAEIVSILNRKRKVKLL